MAARSKLGHIKMKKLAIKLLRKRLRKISFPGTRRTCKKEYSNGPISLHESETSPNLQRKIVAYSFLANHFPL